MPAVGLELAAGARPVVINRAGEERQRRRRRRPAILERGAARSLAPNLEAVPVANDQLWLLPHHRIAHRYRDGVIGLAAASAAGLTIDGSLPALAGACPGLCPLTVAFAA